MMVMVFMLMIMPVVMMMVVAAMLFMNMFMVVAVGNAVGMHPGMVMFMVVPVFFRQHHIKILRLYAAFVHALMNQFIVPQMKPGKLFLQICKRHACIQQCTKQHIPADAGKRFYI